MAGATNRAMKAAGVPKATQNVIRVNGSRGMTLKSAIAVATAHGAPVPDKVHAHIAARDAKAGAKTAKSAATAENAAKRAEARAVYERGNAASGDKLAAMRGEIRQLVSEKRQADRDVTRARDLARTAAEKTLGAPKKGPKARENRLNHARALEAAENASPDVKRAAAAAVQARTALQSALQSRDATATARKAQRGAEAGGQQDLFSGAPAPRQPSPFERRMALRDARALRGAQSLGAVMSARRKAEAARPARAAVLAKSLAATSATALAARKAAATSPANLIRAAEKKHLQGMSIASSRDFARRRLIDAGTARAKLAAAKAEHSAALAKRDDVNARRHLTNAFSRQQADAAVSNSAYNVRKAQEVYSGHMATVKATMRDVRKAEASLPPDVRATVRPQKQGKASLGSSPEARAKMAAVKARLPELRAAREQRLRNQLVRSETVRSLRDREFQFNGANTSRGKEVTSHARATKYGNRARTPLTRMVGSQKAASAMSIAKNAGNAIGGNQYRAKYPRPEK